jgi:hypothetical protein
MKKSKKPNCLTFNIAPNWSTILQEAEEINILQSFLFNYFEAIYDTKRECTATIAVYKDKRGWGATLSHNNKTARISYTPDLSSNKIKLHYHEK